MKPLIKVRILIPADIPAILDIEKECYEEPWEERDFRKAMKRTKGNGMVYEVDQHIVGYVVFDYRRRVLEIRNVTVKEDWRRQGIGTHLASYIRSHLRARMAWVALWESDLPGQLFFKSLGFRWFETIAGKTFGPDFEDEYLMEWLQTELIPPNRLAMYPR